MTRLSRTLTLGLAALVALGCATEGLRADDADTRKKTLEIGGSKIDVAIGPGALDLPETAIFDWLETAARAVTSYYGKFPVKHVTISVSVVRGDRVGDGVTRGGAAPTITLDVGRHATRDALKADWVATHEMVHLAFPDVAADHHWIEEGLATYVEPFARLQTGELKPEKVWLDLVEGLPQGLPEEGDEGLDHTHTWGRTYWGGALFCFLADVEIRKKTENRRGLEDALKGILDAGGSIEVDWTLAKTLEIADRAAKVEVLAKLYETVKATPVNTDLPAIWKDLGIQVRGRKVIFDDKAPHASVRQAIEDPKRWL